MNGFLYKKRRGNIALTAILLVSSILIITGVTLLLSSIDNSYITKDSSNNLYSVFRSNSCLEDALFRLKNNKNYVGTFTITFSDGNCSANVQSDLTSGVKIISTTATVNQYTFTDTKKVDTNQNPMAFIK